MLTINQSEKVALAQQLLSEVKSEILTEYPLEAVLLKIAIQSCEDIAEADNFAKQCAIVLPTEQAWNSNKTTSMFTESVKETLKNVFQYSVMFAGLTCCLSLGHLGASEVFNTNLRAESEFKSQARSYLGIATIAGAVAVSAVILRANDTITNEKKHE